MGHINYAVHETRSLTDSELSRLIKLDKRAWVDDMKTRVAWYFAKKNYAVFSEVPIPTWYYSKYNHKMMLEDFGRQKRADVFCYARYEYVIIETKSSWSDFSSDDKWPMYLEFANKFYFAADHKTAEKILNAIKGKPEYDRIGILAFGADTSGDIHFGFLRNGKRKDVQHAQEEKEKLIHNLIFRGSGFNYGGAPTTMFKPRSMIRLRKIVKWCLDKEQKS